MKTIVIGCGNDLIGDDGVGLHIIRELKKMELPKNINVVEGGTPGLGLIEMLEGFEKAVIIDAVISGSPLGTIHCFDESKLPDKRMLPFSLHGFNVVDAIELGKKVQPEKLPKEIIIVGVEVSDERIYQMGLSSEVSKEVPEAVRKVLEIVEK